MRLHHGACTQSLDEPHCLVYQSDHESIILIRLEQSEDCTHRSPRSHYWFQLAVDLDVLHDMGNCRECQYEHALRDGIHTRFIEQGLSTCCHANR